MSERRRWRYGQVDFLPTNGRGGAIILVGLILVIIMFVAIYLYGQSVMAHPQAASIENLRPASSPEADWPDDTQGYLHPVSWFLFLTFALAGGVFLPAFGARTVPLRLVLALLGALVASLIVGSALWVLHAPEPVYVRTRAPFYPFYPADSVLAYVLVALPVGLGTIGSGLALLLTRSSSISSRGRLTLAVYAFIAAPGLVAGWLLLSLQSFFSSLR